MPLQEALGLPLGAVPTCLFISSPHASQTLQLIEAIHCPLSPLGGLAGTSDLTWLTANLGFPLKQPSHPQAFPIPVSGTIAHLLFRLHSKELSLIPVCFPFLHIQSINKIPEYPKFDQWSPSVCSLVGALLFYGWMTAVVSCQSPFGPCYSLHSSQRTLKKGRWITLPLCLKPSYGF